MSKLSDSYNHYAGTAGSKVPTQAITERIPVLNFNDESVIIRELVTLLHFFKYCAETDSIAHLVKK